MVGHKKSLIPSWLDSRLRLTIDDVEQCARLYRARCWMGLTQAHVAGLLGMSQQNYSRIESGQILPATVDAIPFCALFRADLVFIFKGSDYKDGNGEYQRIRPARKPKGSIKLHGDK